MVVIGANAVNNTLLMTAAKPAMQAMRNAAQSQRGEQAREIAAEASKGKLMSGLPIFVTLDEIVGPDEIKGHLVVDTFGVKAGQRITLKQADGHTSERNSLKTAIAGNDWVAPLVKGDIIGFERGYVENNKVMVGAVAARVHDKLLGEVQVMTAMTRPTKAVVNKKGALQSGIIADGAKAMVVNSVEGLRAAFDRIRSERWPGGNPGFIIRDNDGQTDTFFQTSEKTIDHLIEDLIHADVAPAADYLLELIPAWSLPMGKEQIVKDVNPKNETGKAVVGKFSSQYMTGNELGFLPSLVIVSMEEEWAFGGKTGKIIPVISSMAPVFKREAVSAGRLPTSKRAYGGTPNTILKLYDDEALKRMNFERINRRGYENPEPSRSSSSGRKYDTPSGGQNDDDEYGRPSPRMSFGRR